MKKTLHFSVIAVGTFILLGVTAFINLGYATGGDEILRIYSFILNPFVYLDYHIYIREFVPFVHSQLIVPLFIIWEFSLVASIYTLFKKNLFSRTFTILIRIFTLAVIIIRIGVFIFDKQISHAGVAKFETSNGIVNEEAFNCYYLDKVNKRYVGCVNQLAKVETDKNRAVELCNSLPIRTPQEERARAELIEKFGADTPGADFGARSTCLKYIEAE